MADNGDTNVVYTLAIETDPASRQQLKDWGDAFKTAQKSQTKAAKDESKERAKADREAAREKKAALRDEVRAEKQAAAQAEKVTRNRIRLLGKMAAEDRKRRAETLRDMQRESRERQRQIKAWQREHEMASAQITTANDQMVERFASGTESVARFARGFAALGLVGEDSTTEILKGLVKLQAGFDIVVGGTNAVLRLTKGVQAYRAAQAASATATAAESKLLVQDAAAANLAAGAHSRLAAARGASAAAAAGGVAPTVIGGGAGIAGAGAGAGGGAAAAGGMVAPIAAGAAAFAGVTAAIWTSVDSFKGLTEHGLGAGVAVGSLTDKIATYEVKFIQFFGFMGKSIKAVADAEAKLAGKLEQRARAEAQGAVRAEAGSRIASLGDAAFDARRALSGGSGQSASERRTGAQGGLRRERRELARMLEIRKQMDNTTADSSRAAVTERIAALYGRMAGHGKDLLDAERQAAETRRQSLDAAIDKTRSRIQLAKDERRDARQSLMSAAERFGEMSPEQRSELIRIQAKAQRAGRSATQGFSGTDAQRESRGREAAAAALTQAERAALGGLGTGGARDVQRRGALQVARGEGFFDRFGSEEQRRQQTAGRAQQQLEVKLQDQRDLRVSIDSNDDEIARNVTNQVVALMQRRDRELVDRITTDFEARMTELNSNANQFRTDQAKR